MRITFAATPKALTKKYIMPRVLQGIELKEIDLSTQLLGIPA
ncbi:L-lactate oxidase [Salmonella enterica subsp. enterica]|uniref:L-lactate oxidase n=1 Tax=Salmonella enterica I TaxID=59201 RepID=A0A447U2W2_SALET|nr:L-lactate oxidase [Salmonella enterica subsp. enterica]